MPVLDSCHAQVIRALQKDGWNAQFPPEVLRLEARRIVIDIRAARQINGHSEQIIFVEVKCFAETGIPTRDLYAAIGQYLVYRTVLSQLHMPLPVLLAVPEDAYAALFDSTIQQVVADNDIKLIVVDLKREVIVQWKL